MSNKFYILDDIFSKSECGDLYTSLISSNVWNLNRGSKGSEMIGRFPGFEVFNNGTTNDLFWQGYFASILNRIKSEFNKKFNFDLPNKIIRIHLGAKNDSIETNFHCDEKLHNAFTIVGFILPYWDPKWGGSINVEGDEVEIKPGRFLIFKTNTLHNGSGPKETTPIWRISINYVIQN